MRLAACLNRDVLKRAAQVLLGAVRQWSTHRAASKGAALSFYTLFSMAPVLVLVISIAGLFFGEQAARGEIFGQIEGLVGAQGRPQSRPCSRPRSGPAMVSSRPSQQSPCSWLAPRPPSPNSRTASTNSGMCPRASSRGCGASCAHGCSRSA